MRERRIGESLRRAGALRKGHRNCHEWFRAACGLRRPIFFFIYLERRSLTHRALEVTKIERIKILRDYRPDFSALATIIICRVLTIATGICHNKHDANLIFNHFSWQLTNER